MIKYNNNINLIEKVISPQDFKKELKESQFFALMVTDYPRFSNDGRKWFNKDKGWLGLECITEGKIYITKKIKLRTDLYRGETWLIEVSNPNLCYILDRD